jgi:type III restriction enzyme
VARIELLPFQQTAVNNLVETALTYFAGSPDTMGGRAVPFVGQLKAVTGAGKTPILASTVGRLAPSIILWTTKYGSVVDQTFTNLTTGGKYHHLLGTGKVEIIRFADIPSYAVWQRILEDQTGLTILISTVAAWNSAEKDERLNVHRVHADWGAETRWQQLKTLRSRPLWVVYDEAHNTTTEQVELLDDLDPTGFFIASASPVKGKLQYYLTMLPAEQRAKRFVSVRTRDVVDAELLKATISVADYDGEPEEMIRDAAQRRTAIEQQIKTFGATTVPKAIYVVESSNTPKGATSRPTAIWNVLTTACGVPPDAIAVCTNTKGLPTNAIAVKTIDQLSDQFTHIIFNKRLQEGWDDPGVYVCYFDGETGSATRIQQVIGRALRQPEGRHFGDEDLNTAYFFVNCPNEALEGIVDDLKEELRIYKGDDEPDDFEPFQIKEERKKEPKIPLRPGVGPLTVPRLQLELPSTDHLEKLLKKKTYDFTDADRAAPGKAIISVVSVKTGDVKQQERDLLEDMRMPCGRYLSEQIRTLSKSCLNSMNPALFTNDRLDKTACFGSKALTHYRELAIELVREYENHVRLGLLADPEERLYTVGPYQPSGSVHKNFDHSAHPYYDAKAFVSTEEGEMAKALDKLPYTWARNKDRLDYGIPLPQKSASSATFYPDFLWWVNGSVWAIDPTGKHLLDEKIRSKLLTVPEPLRIALVTRGKRDESFKKIAEDGWTLVRLRLGNAAPETFDSLADLLGGLVEETVAAGQAT